MADASASASQSVMSRSPLQKPYKCAKCHTVFDQRSHYEAHLARKTPCDQPDLRYRPYKCHAAACEARYTAESNRNRHSSKCPYKITADVTKLAQRAEEALKKLAIAAGKTAACHPARDLALDLVVQLQAGTQLCSSATVRGNLLLNSSYGIRCSLNSIRMVMNWRRVMLSDVCS